MGGAAVEVRLDGGLRLAGGRGGTAALIWELGSGNRKTNEGNGLRGYF